MYIGILKVSYQKIQKVGYKSTQQVKQGAL